MMLLILIEYQIKELLLYWLYIIIDMKVILKNHRFFPSFSFYSTNLHHIQIFVKTHQFSAWKTDGRMFVGGKHRQGQWTTTKLVFSSPIFWKEQRNLSLWRSSLLLATSHTSILEIEKGKNGRYFGFICFDVVADPKELEIKLNGAKCRNNILEVNITRFERKRT